MAKKRRERQEIDIISAETSTEEESMKKEADNLIVEGNVSASQLTLANGICSANEN